MQQMADEPLMSQSELRECIQYLQVHRHLYTVSRKHGDNCIVTHDNSTQRTLTNAGFKHPNVRIYTTNYSHFNLSFALSLHA